MSEDSRIDQFESLLATHPDSEMLRYALGNAYLDAGRAAEAVESFRAATRLKPDYTAAYRQLGRALEHTGEREEAREAYLRGIEIGRTTGDLQTVKEMQVFLKRLGNA